jgi:uncharacterized membrane protein (UPF0127 family)
VSAFSIHIRAERSHRRRTIDEFAHDKTVSAGRLRRPAWTASVRLIGHRLNRAIEHFEELRVVQLDALSFDTVLLLHGLGHDIVSDCRLRVAHTRRYNLYDPNAVCNLEPFMLELHASIISEDMTIARLSLEAPETQEERETGLSARPDLNADQGMIFLFKPAQPARIWMKDAQIPLDIIFLGEELTIESIVHGAPPGTETMYWAPRFVEGVLEIAAGAAATLGLSVGDRVQIER